MKTMSEISLQPGRMLVRISDCCDQITDRVDNPSRSGFDRFVGLEHLHTRETTIRDWGSTADVTSTMKLFITGDVLVARRNVYLERAAKADFYGVCSGDAIVLRPKENPCLPSFLPYILNTDKFWMYANSQADGSMSKRLSIAKLMDYEFALPPQQEQQRIVQLLISIENILCTYDLLHKSIYVLRKSIVRHYLENNSDSPLVSIGDVVEINPECTRGLKPYDTINYIDISSVSEQNGVTEGEVKPYKFEDAPSRARRVVRRGDTILSTVRIYLRSYALIDEVHDGNVVSTGFCVLRPNKNLILPEFLFALIKSDEFIGLMNAYSTGTNYPSVSIEDIAAYNIPLLPLNKQMEIIKILSSLSLAEKNIRLRKGRFTVFKKMVLDSL